MTRSNRIKSVPNATIVAPVTTLTSPLTYPRTLATRASYTILRRVQRAAYLHHRLRKPPCSFAQIPRCTLMLIGHRVHTPARSLLFPYSTSLAAPSHRSTLHRAHFLCYFLYQISLVSQPQSSSQLRQLSSNVGATRPLNYPCHLELTNHVPLRLTDSTRQRARLFRDYSFLLRQLLFFSPSSSFVPIVVIPVDVLTVQCVSSPGRTRRKAAVVVRGTTRRRKSILLSKRQVCHWRCADDKRTIERTGAH